MLTDPECGWEDMLYDGNGDNNIDFELLSEQYSPLIDSLSGKFYAVALHGGLSADYDDLHQEAVIALARAAETYNQSQMDVTFGLYAKVCIRNRLISVLRKLSRRIAEIIPYDDTEQSGIYPDPASKLIESENYGNLIKIIDSVLTEYEKSVLELYISGMSYRGISDVLGVSEKSVDNAIYRIKAKLRKNM